MVLLSCGTCREQCRQGVCTPRQILTDEAQLIFQRSVLHHWAMRFDLSSFLLPLIYLEVGYQVAAGTKSGGFQRTELYVRQHHSFHQNNRKDKDQHSFYFCCFLALKWEEVTQFYPFSFPTLTGHDGMCCHT